MGKPAVYFCSAVAALLLAACDQAQMRPPAKTADASNADAHQTPRMDIRNIELGMSVEDVTQRYPNCVQTAFVNDERTALICPVEDGDLTVRFTSQLTGTRVQSVSYCFESQLYVRQLAATVAEQYRIPPPPENIGGEYT